MLLPHSLLRGQLCVALSMQHFTLLIREQAQNLTTSGISLQGEVKSPHIMNRKQFIVQVVEWVIEIVQL